MKIYFFSLALLAFLPIQFKLINPVKSWPVTEKNAGLPVDEPTLLRMSVDGGMLGEDPCFRHGGTVGVGVSWNIATCKSDCNRGLGFRCGGDTYVRCEDGTIVVVGHRTGGCPNSTIERRVNADISFYDNNTAILSFKSALPAEEINNSDFEVEGDATVNLPAFLLINGHHYSSYTVKQGTYRVNRDVGEFGQVTVDVSLNE